MTPETGAEQLAAAMNKLLRAAKRRRSSPAAPLAPLPPHGQRVASAHPWDRRDAQVARRLRREADAWAAQMAAAAEEIA